jgi:hypothetical protein
MDVIIERQNRLAVKQEKLDKRFHDVAETTTHISERSANEMDTLRGAGIYDKYSPQVREQLKAKMPCREPQILLMVFTDATAEAVWVEPFFSLSTSIARKMIENPKFGAIAVFTLALFAVLTFLMTLATCKS